MRPFISPQVTSSVLPLALAILWCSAAFGQPPKAVSQDQTLVTKDGVDIKITYFKSAGGQEAPVVILLHGKGGNRLVWKSFAEQLQKIDFAVITVDLRGHGESTGGGESSDKKPDTPKKAELAAMAALDLDAVKKFIYEEHQNKNLNMNKLGIVASDITAIVALGFTEIDWEKVPYDDAPTPAQRTPRGQDVQAIALLSPEGSGANKTLGAIRYLKRPVLIIAGAKNATDLKEAKKMHEILAPKKEGFEFMYLEQYDSKLRGTDLLGKGLKTEQHLGNFLMKHVKEARGEWRDRKSKLLD